MFGTFIQPCMKIITLIFMFTKTMAFYIVLRHDQIYSRVNNVKSCLDTHLRDPEASAELSPPQYCKQNPFLVQGIIFAICRHCIFLLF